jgi:hypothetical protein
LGDELRQVGRDDLPDHIKIHVQIIVDELVAHSDDVAPGDLRIFLSRLGTHPASGFPDHLNEVGQSEAKVIVPLEIIPTLSTNFVDRLHGYVQHMPEV